MRSLASDEAKGKVLGPGIVGTEGAFGGSTWKAVMTLVSLKGLD